MGRLLRMIVMIRGDPRWRPAAIAEHLGVSRKSVQRDIQRLKAGGVPVYFDHAGGGYRIRRGFFLPPIDLTADEACALLLLAERVGGAERLPLTRSAARGLEKLRAGLPDVLRADLAEVLDRVTFHLAAGEGDGVDKVWSTVSRAIAERRQLRCCYEAVHGRECSDGGEAFAFDPLHMYFGQRAWYVIGLHHGRSDLRTLKLARFDRVEPAGTFFDPPDDFDLKRYLGQAWRMIPGDRVRRRVVLRFDPQVAETVTDTLWHATQSFEHDADGSLRFTCEIDGLDEIVYWVLGYGKHCEVLEPAELRERVAEHVKAMARVYAGG